MATHHPILHVEDNKEDVYLVKYAFQQVGITNPIQVAMDGQEAMDYLSAAGEFSNRAKFPMPCMVLLDLKLPKKMGLEVLEWIRSQPSLKWLIVIILSASVNENDVRRAYALGANAFLVKPANLAKLTDMCRALRDFWIINNEPPVECWEM